MVLFKTLDLIFQFAVFEIEALRSDALGKNRDVISDISGFALSRPTRGRLRSSDWGMC